MINSILCWIRSRNEKRHLFSLDPIKEEERILLICDRDISILKFKLDKCIENNKISDALEFKGEYLDNSYLDDIKKRELKRKKNVNEVLKLFNFSNGDDYKVSKEDIEKKIQSYNKDLAIIKKVKNYCKAIGYKAHNNDSVYIKFGRDKLNDLMVIYFNIDSFIFNDKKSIAEVAFVFAGEGEYPLYQHTLLHLKRYGESSVLIWRFKSTLQKRGHGTFLLRSLEEIIRKINNRLIELDNADEDFRKEPIEVIIGDVIPGNITYDDLVTFYNKNGYPTIKKDYDFDVKTTIYKELNKTSR